MLRKMQPKLGERIISDIDNRFENSPFKQWGAESREKRQTNYSSKYSSTLADSTASPDTSFRAAVGGRTQVIGDRPMENLAARTDGEKKAYFEALTTTKLEGDPKPKLSESFKKMNEAHIERMNRLKVSPDKFKVTGLREVGGDGNPNQELSKGDYFKATEVKKYINLDPEIQEKITGAGVMETANTDNIDLLLDGLYGDDFRTKLDQLLSERLADGRTNSDTQLDNIIDLVEHGTPGVTYSKDGARQLIKVALKAALLQNPENAKSIILALDSATDIQLSTLPGFVNNLKKTLIKECADSYSILHPEFFSGTATQTEILENRKKVVEKLTNGTNATLSATGATDLDLSILDNLEQITNLPIWDSTTTNGLFEKKSPGDRSLISFQSNLYRGIYAGFSGEMARVSREISFAISADPTKAKTIFEKLYRDIVMVGSDSSKPIFDRISSLAKVNEAIRGFGATPGSKLAKRLERISSKLEEYSSPAGIAFGLEKDLLYKIADTLATSGVDVNELKKSINDAIQLSPIDKAIYERLSVLIPTLPTEDQKKEAFALLRGAGNVELLINIADKLCGGDQQIRSQYLIVLLDKFVFKAGQEDTNAQTFLDILYAKASTDVVVSLGINTDVDIKRYLNALFATTAPATYQEKLDINGQASSGSIYARAHELYGTIRKGVEVAEWSVVGTKSDPEIKQYLIDSFGIQADSKQLEEALARFKEITVGTGTGFKLSEIISKAKTGDGTQYGSNYTNLASMLQHYVIHGGELETILRDAEKMSMQAFMESVQKDANQELGAPQGAAMNEQNRVLTLEEQRAAVQKNYEDLSGSNGFVNFLRRMKAAIPRVLKAAGFMAITALGAAFPVIAGPIALGMAAMRVWSIYKIAKAGIPMIKEAWAKGDSKVAWGIITGVVVSTAINVLVPTPWGIGLGLVGETVGLDIFAASKLKEEAEIVLNSHAQYEAAVEQYINNLDPNNEDHKKIIIKLAKSINASLTTTATGIDFAATWTNIKQQRDLARDTANRGAKPNITLLRQYSQALEEIRDLETTTKAVHDANLKAKTIYEDAQRTMMAYSLASGAAKLGFSIGRGWEAGWREGEGGILGGVLGTLGIADYRTLFDFHRESASSGTEASTSNITEENVHNLQNDLERQLNVVTDKAGLDPDDSTVIGMVHTTDGHTYAMVDLDGDPNTVESIIPITADGRLDFTDIVSRTETSGIGHGGVEGYQDYEYTAVAGDSQWSMIENVLRMRYPTATDQQIWNMTGNVLNEAGIQKVYDVVYNGHTSGTVWIGDKLDLSEIEKIAPNAFARGEANLPISDRTSLPSITESNIVVDFPPNHVDSEFSGGIVFDTPEGIGVAGNTSFLNTFFTASDGSTLSDGTGQGGSVTPPSTDDNTNDDDNKGIDWRTLILGKEKAETATDTGSGGTQPLPGKDTFVIKDPGLIGKDSIEDESAVKEFIVHGRLGDRIIKPSEVDIVEVTKNGVTYIDPNTLEKVYVENMSGDIGITLADDSTITFAGGTNNVIDSVAHVTDHIASGAENVTQSLKDLNTELDRVIAARDEYRTVFNDFNSKIEDLTGIDLIQLQQNITESIGNHFSAYNQTYNFLNLEQDKIVNYVLALREGASDQSGLLPSEVINTFHNVFGAETGATTQQILDFTKQVTNDVSENIGAQVR